MKVWPYLDTPDQWDAAIAYIRETGTAGLDTETYGHNVKESSPAYRAKIDVWSIAVLDPDAPIHPRGYQPGRAAVLPAAALDYPAWRDVLADLAVEWVLHNAGHDKHSLENHGIKLGRIWDTLEASRLLWPGLGSYALKPLRSALLGKPEREGFKELTASEKRTVTENVTKVQTFKICSCGVEKCKKKKPGWDHVKTEGTRTWVEPREKERTFAVPIESIGPGHPRWARKLNYAGDDAVDGLELWQLCATRTAQLDSSLPNLPWRPVVIGPRGRYVL